MQHGKGQVQVASAYCRYYSGMMHWYYVVNLEPHLQVLAGIWPCGIVTLLDEVFVAESISQVYGSVHSLIHSNLQNTSEITEYKI